MLNNLPKDILLNIWSYDNTILNNYKQCLIEINKLFNKLNNKKKTLMIHRNDVIEINSINRLIKNIDQYIKKNYNKMITKFKFKEYEIYVNDDKINYIICFIL